MSVSLYCKYYRSFPINSLLSMSIIYDLLYLLSVSCEKKIFWTKLTRQLIHISGKPSRFTINCSEIKALLQTEPWGFGRPPWQCLKHRFKHTYLLTLHLTFKFRICWDEVFSHDRYKVPDGNCSYLFLSPLCIYVSSSATTTT